MARWFDTQARSLSAWLGRSSVFFGACAAIIVWAAVGPLVGFSNGWQLTINTGTTVVTFLMLFVVQNTQNRDALALHAKIDALIAASEAPDTLQAIEEATEDEIRQAREGERT